MYFKNNNVDKFIKINATTLRAVDGVLAKVHFEDPKKPSVTLQYYVTKTIDDAETDGRLRAIRNNNSIDDLNIGQVETSLFDDNCGELIKAFVISKLPSGFAYSETPIQ